MDQAASQNQGLFGHYRKCGQDSDMDCHFHVRSRGHYEKDLESGPKSLQNFTSFERDSFRENAYITGTCQINLHQSKGASQQPLEFIQLTLGQQ
jgi:hypothetical protein